MQRHCCDKSPFCTSVDTLETFSLVSNVVSTVLSVFNFKTFSRWFGKNPLMRSIMFETNEKKKSFA